jgi:ankyrin repeat protein
MYQYRLLAFASLCHMSTLFGVVLLEPTSWDRNAPLAPIKRDPLCTSFSRGEGSSTKPIHGTLIVTIASRPETRLQQAVVDNDQTLIRQLLDDKEDPNVQNHHGFTALHFAAALGYTDLVALLLSKKADPNIPDDLAHATPLHVAFTDNNPEIIELLVTHGADVTTPDIYGYTPLHSAAAGNALETANILLQAGADTNTTTFEETEAMMRCGSTLKLSTPLHEAAMHGRAEMVQLLIQHGAPVDAMTLDNKTPLNRALKYAHMEVAHILLQQGSDINKAREEGFLCQAALKGDCEIAELLIASGADVNESVKIENKSGLFYITPLFCACQSQNSLPLVQLLVKHNARINDVTINESTPLIAAIEFGDMATVCFLIEQGADVNLADTKGTTPLHMASFHNKIDIVKMLVENGARIGVWLSTKETPLQIAIRENHHELAEFLRNLEVPEEPEESVMEIKEVSHELVAQVQMEELVVDTKSAVIESAAMEPAGTPRNFFLTNCYNMCKKNPQMCIILGILIAYGIKNAAQYCAAIAQTIGGNPTFSSR